MDGKFRVVFDGRLNSEIPSTEVRGRLLRLYRNDQQSVDLFFTGKRLIISRNLDQAAALKKQAIMEKAGVPCRVIADEPETQRANKATADPATNVQKAMHIPARQANESSFPAKTEEQEARPHDFSFRGIIAEAWNLIRGVKGVILVATLITAILLTVLTSLGYGITRLSGEPGRNLYLVYAFLYGFGMLGYPFYAGLIMMGIKRAAGEQLSVSMIFHFYNARILLLSLILMVADYAQFALLLSLGIDHFYARASSIFIFPVFALTAPLVAQYNMSPVAALGRFLLMFRRHFRIMFSIYTALAAINLFGSFVLIGFVWTIPLFFVANGVMFRNMLWAEKSEKEVPGVRLRTPQEHQRTAIQPALRGNDWQNALALTFVCLIIAAAGIRLWALNSALAIYLPDHVASNGRMVCIHADKVLYFLSPEGRTLQHMQLDKLGLRREPAEVELLSDGNLLIGDMDKKTILRCSREYQACLTLGPAANCQIKDNFKFLADEKRGLLFIADTNNHRILIQDMAGTYCRTLESRASIDYPNDMTMDEQGMLWVSNTLHERILGFQVEGSTVSETDRAINLNPLESGVSAIGEALLKTKDKAQTLRDLKAAQIDMEALKKDLPSAALDMLHARPAALSWGADGNLWAVASDPIRTTAGIRVFDPSGKQVRSIHLERGAIPDDIARSGEQMLVADIGLFQVFTVRSESGTIIPFGDETFQRALADSRSRLERYEAIGKWMKLILWASAIATTILLIIILRKRRASEKGRAENETP